ncbi:MAG TPA: 4-alpha-glucanotransferase [Gemmatimonadaceae bacterium]|nr:4-alpha-glucanotransferase [Gemmatimonadaceae bacterium]
MSHDGALRELAERLGVLSSYLSQDGSERRSTSDDTRSAILAAMGYDVPSEERARAVLAELEASGRERVADPVLVIRERELRARASPEERSREVESREAAERGPRPRAAGAGGLRFHVPESWGVRAGERIEYTLAIGEEESPVGKRADRADEAGRAEIAEGGAMVGEGGWLTIALERPPVPGYYHAVVGISARGRSTEARQRLVVVPDRCVTPARPGYGIIANLYSVRGARSWGVGDLTDLADLARWSGEHGAAFVGVNPLHALRTVGGEVSPYSPVSRLYRNPAYLDIEAIPELVACSGARAMLSEDSMRAELARIRSSDRVEYERRARLARPVLEALHRCFTERGSSDDARQRAYAAYREREGLALDEFATFMALDEHFVRDSNASVTWRQWPPEYHSPHSPAVLEFARAHEREIDFHRWLQFELDRQLAAAAAAGSRAGLSIGLYQDLAVASAPYGSDVWSRPDLHAHGVTFGAPPDDYSATGQNWGLTPLNPHRLHHDGYRFWTALVRSALQHAGALRIDHILGVFRQFWIPAGMTGTDGAYVRFPTDDLMGILALESARLGAVIVGEDLGTVPPEVPGTLRQWGILGTRVLIFERERDGAFRPASSYEPLSLTTADTHDLPTLAGFWEGKDIALAARLGKLPDAAAEAAALRSRQNDRRLLAERLIADGALGSASAGAELGRPISLPDAAELRDAVHRFLCSTPAILVGISLDDLAGETEPVNVPGVSAEHFASWTRRMHAPLAELMARDDVIPPGGCERRGGATGSGL